jgi:deazaflavin-dependent oxidoreductase (nitroreductase family)
MTIWQHIQNRIRYFNKRILNRVVAKFAGSSNTPFVIIRHVGRRSGKLYETPIIAMPVAGGFVVALTYGVKVDWYRNVLAAGRCTVVWHGRAYAIERIEPLDKQIAVMAFPFPFRQILGRIGTQDFVRITYLQLA